MLRQVKGFHQHPSKKWCAELECGHTIDVSSPDTPFQYSGFQGEKPELTIGVKLDCPCCDDRADSRLKTDIEH
jgi:hypothetical protein